MPADERVLSGIKGWVEKAESDLKAALLALKAREDCPTDAVAFHAQQCAEKYLKSYLLFKGIDFPKTHDIRELVARAEGLEAGLSREDSRALTIYATTTRYPGDYEPISLAEARHAVALARKVRGTVRKKLPKSVLKKRARR